MKKDELKERLGKADERILVMMKKYPVVFALLTGVPFILGIILGRFVL